MLRNVGGLLARRARLDPKRTALVYRGCRFSFRELSDLSNRWTHAFTDLGVTKGDHIGVLLANCSEFVEALFGLAKTGAVLVPLNPRNTVSELVDIAKDSGFQTLIFGNEFLRIVESLRSRLKLRSMLCAGEHAPSWANDLSIIGQYPTDEISLRTTPNDHAIIIYTSGTTGRAKGATLTHENLFWWAATMHSTLDIRPDDHGLVVAPLFHSIGVLFALTYVSRGCMTVLGKTNPFDPPEILETVLSENVNHFAAVPTMLYRLSQVPRFEEYFASVRWLFSGGSHITPQLIQTYWNYGIRVLQIYGLTETGPLLAIADPAKGTPKMGSVGLPFLLTDVRIVDTKGTDVAPKQVGEIITRGPNVMREYWRNPVATREAFRDGWFSTGDLAIMDEDGYVYIVDRKNDLISSGGEHVYPTEVESVLSVHPKIDEVAVIGMPDEKWGEAVCAIVRPRIGQNLTLQEIDEFCGDKLARFKIPRRLVLRDEALPRSSSGKILKTVLRARYRSAGEKEGQRGSEIVSRGVEDR